MKVKVPKSKGRPSKKLDKQAKKQKAAKLSKASRVVTKISRAVPESSRKPPKGHSKMKQYSLRALTEYFEDKFNVSVSSEKGLSLAQKKFRNKYLFPCIKEGGVVYKRSDILFDEKEALTYLQMLSRTLDKSDDYYMEDVPYLEVNKKSLDNDTYKNDNIVIKKTSNLSTVSEAWSGNEDAKHHNESEDEQYIDQYEVEYLNKLKKTSKTDTKKQHMKWLGKALDSFRLVENHKKSGIFYEPYIPSDIDSHRKSKSSKVDPDIEYPITLKTIGIQLSLGLYRTYEDFKFDMKWMFSNSKKYLKKSKLLKDWESIEKRFLNF